MEVKIVFMGHIKRHHHFQANQTVTIIILNNIEIVKAITTMEEDEITTIIIIDHKIIMEIITIIPASI